MIIEGYCEVFFVNNGRAVVPARDEKRHIVQSPAHMEEW